AVLARRFRAVKISFGHPPILQFIDAPARLRSQLLDRAELYGIGRAGLRASRLDAVLLPVVTERAFASMAVWFAAAYDAERASRDAIAAAVADVLLHVNIAEFVVDDGACRTCLLAGRLDAMLANIAHHQPAARAISAAAVELFDERDVAPGLAGQTDRVV